MECNLALTLLHLTRRELTVADQAALDQHLAACPTCAERAHHLTRFDVHVAAAMQAVPVPAELHARLIKTAFAHRGAQLRRKVYQAAALAATVLVTLGLALGGYWQSRPNLDSYALATRTEIEHEHRQQAVQDWLIARNLPTRLPYEFNFRLCLFHGFEEIQDRNVPVVIFSLGRDQARVYYVRKDQFKTDDARFAKSSLCTVEVHPSADPDVVIVISYTTDRLDPFLLRGPIGPIT